MDGPSAEEKQAMAGVIYLLMDACQQTPHGRKFIKSLPDDLRGDALAIASDHRERIADQ